MHKNKVKWIKDLNIRHDTIKLLEESIGTTFSDINHTHVFLVQSPTAIEIKINQQDLIALTSFCKAIIFLKKGKTTYGIGQTICKQSD